MTGKITIEGVTLTTAEAEEVLAWVEAPCGPVPQSLVLRPSGPAFIRANADLPLTPAIVEQLRDHVRPWTEVRRDEVKPGEVFRYMGREYTAGQGHNDWCNSETRIASVYGGEAVLVRRPRALTLGQVEPGQRFRFALSEGYVHRRTVQGWLEEATWMHATADDLHLTMPVEILKDQE